VIAHAAIQLRLDRLTSRLGVLAHDLHKRSERAAFTGSRAALTPTWIKRPQIGGSRLSRGRRRRFYLLPPAIRHAKAFRHSCASTRRKQEAKK